MARGREVRDRVESLCKNAFVRNHELRKLLIDNGVKEDEIVTCAWWGGWC